MLKKVVLLRVGVDAGCGGIQGPLFRDGSFEFVCIPDGKKVSKHTYGNCIGRNGLPHSQYFSERRRERMFDQHVHVDPEFETLTYGDPTTPKRSLRRLEKGDLLVFYAGLQGWDEGWHGPPALYIVGFFEVAKAGMASKFSKSELAADFGNNFHVRYPSVFKAQRNELVLVKVVEEVAC